MISVKEVAAAWHNTDAPTRGQCQGIGRALSARGIKTGRIAGVTYIDLPIETTVEDIVRRITEEPTRSVVARQSRQQPRLQPDNNGKEKITLDKALHIIEAMWTDLQDKAAEIHDLKMQIASLREQTGDANRPAISATVKTAMVQYGD